MTPAHTLRNYPHPRRLIARLTFVTILLALAAAGGCRKPVNTHASNENSGAKADPWKAAAARLKKDTDLTATKQALATINSDSSQQAGEKLPAITPEQLAALAALVPLSAGDREELGGAAFSTHDPAYVADCLYLRDVARSLEPAGRPPEKQADLAFAWVCRQVYLHPWPRNVGSYFEPTALPPTAVLRRGSGSGLERMYVFLALLQQLGLDGCLIGGPDAVNKQSREGPALSYATVTHVRVPRGPFWAVGVRLGNDVRLFDPFGGQPFPVTLNQLRANPEAAKGWFEDKANISGATLADARSATAYLAVPVNALSPRTAVFEAKMKGELGAKFAYDLKALESMRAAFPDPKPAFWNPPEDPFAYGRVSRSYLPLELGGGDRTPQSPVRLYEASMREQIPPGAFALPPALAADLPENSQVRQELGTRAALLLAVAFIEPPNPRERIQRGRFQEAAMDLVAKQEAFAAGLERLRTDASQQTQAAREWVENAERLHRELTQAQSVEKNAAKAEAISRQIENLWKQKPALVILDMMSAEVGRAEAAYLLALCKHEQAERLQARLERAGADARKKADALDAWRTASDAWRTYEQLASAHAGLPGRSEHARTLAARAARLAQTDAKK